MFSPLAADGEHAVKSGYRSLLSLILWNVICSIGPGYRTGAVHRRYDVILGRVARMTEERFCGFNQPLDGGCSPVLCL